MRRTRKSLPVILLALLLGSAAPAWSQVATEDPSQQADEHFRQGTTLLKAGKKREAREEYLAAFRLKRSHDIAGNLGSVELALGMPRDAAEHLSFAIRHYAPSGTTPEQLEKAKQRLAEAKRQVGRVTVSVTVPGAEVLVDGVSVGRAPLEGEVFVDPGTRTILARLDGHEDAAQAIEAGKGTEHHVTLTLLPSTRGAPPMVGGPADVPPVPTVRPLEKRGPSTALLVAGGVTAGVVLVTGAVFAAVSNGKANSADATKAALVESHGAAACTGAQPSGCATLIDINRTKDAFGNAALWSFVAAGVIGAGTGVYALAAPRGEPRGGWRVAPVVTAQGGGVVVGGAW